MNRKTTFLMILAALAAALLAPLLMDQVPLGKQRHVIRLEAGRYGYTPARIKVARGDTIVLKPTSKDVTHGFDLDGYPVSLIIKQQGVAYQQYTWQDDDGRTQSDWDKVSEVEFTADKAGKFIFRCTQVCGNLHPFMTGELVVTPNQAYHWAVSLSIWVVLSVLLWGRFSARRRTGPDGPGINLLACSRLLNWLMHRRSLHFALLFPGVVIFYLFILSALWGSPVGNRNIAIIFVWILWWFALKAIFVPLGGRLWCMICPLPAPAEWLSRKALTAVHVLEKPFRGLRHRFVGLQRDWPKALRNMWPQNLIFMTMISFGIILITRPVATAILFLAILIATIALALVYRRRVFCLYLCPVGGFLGNYSMASMTAVRAVDPQVCRGHKEKCCLAGGKDGWACPWGQYVGTMDRNNHCGVCTECIKSCPKDNVGFFLRPFGSDRRLNGYDEMVNVIIMLVVAIAFSLTMLSPWGQIRDAANITETRQLGPYLTYLAVLWGAALVVAPALFMAATRGARAMAGGGVDYKPLTLALAYILIPVGIFSWIAFSLPSVMINYHYILGVLSDPLGLGWDLFGTANAHYHPLIPQWIPAIQGVLLLAGLYFGLSRGRLAVAPLLPEVNRQVRAMVLPSLFALAVVNVLLKLYLG